MKRSANSNIIFFGATELGYNCCEHLIKSGHNIAAIFTIPKQFSISYSPGKPVTNVLHKDFFELGEQCHIPVISVDKSMHEYADAIAGFTPDLMIVIGWYYIIPESIRNLSRLGCIGIHASLLPKYRGGAPLVWAMINGESTTGLSLFYFDSGIDTGDIIAQESFPIEEHDTIKDLLAKLNTASLHILEQYIPAILGNTAPRIPQNHDEATYYPQRKPEDGEINWDWDKEKIKNFIRAQTKPYPGAFTNINGRKVVLWDVDIV